MNNPKQKSLGAAITISKGKKHNFVDYPSDQAKRILTIDDLRNDKLIRYTEDTIGTEVNVDDIMIAWDGANAGTIGYGKSGYIGSTIARIRIKEKSKLNTHFLGLYLQSKFDYLRKTATGAIIPHISRQALEKIPLPEVTLDNQIRIANLLGRVVELIAQHKQHLKDLDKLLKSVFLEMFGPQSAGYTDWPLVEIKDLAAKHKGAMRTGPFGSNLLHSEFTSDGDVAVLGIDNAVQNRFAWDERRFITIEKYKELESYRIFPGDVIVTIMGTIGRSAVVPNDVPLAINTKHLAAITLNRELANPLFLSYSIHSSPYILNQFRRKNRGAIMSGLNLGLIKETKVKRPPIELQNKFSDTHAHIDEVKAMYQQRLADLEALYGALSQRAFKGELDLSRISLPEFDSKQEAPDLARQETPAKPKKKNLVDNAFNGKSASEVTFIEYLKTKGNTVFSGEELYSELSSLRLDNSPPLTDFKTLLIKLLEMPQPVLKQVFEILDSEKQGSPQGRPRVAFKVIQS